METPKNARQLRPARNPTPRLSERKKGLFAPNKDEVQEVDEDILDGITPLDATDAITTITTNQQQQIAANDLTSPKTTSRRSLRLNQKSNALNLQDERNGKENIPMQSMQTDDGAEEHLQILFSSSMRLNGQQHSPKKMTDVSQIAANAQPQQAHAEISHKRQYDTLDASSSTSPKRKAIKVSSSPTEAGSISTKSFYSLTKVSPKSNSNGAKNLSTYVATAATTPTHVSPRSRRNERRSQQLNINKGVSHKIRRPVRPLGSSSQHVSKAQVDLILGNLRNEKLRKLIISKREEKVQIEKVHQIFRDCNNPINMARPLSALNVALTDEGDSNNNNNFSFKNDSKQQTQQREAEFSDIEYESDDSVEGIETTATSKELSDEIIPLITHHSSDIEPNTSPSKSPTAKRKFFKSGRSTNTRKEVRITGNIRASVCNGKISLVQEKKRKRRLISSKKSSAYEFTDEQATVDAILKNLDDTTYGDIVENIDTNESPKTLDSCDQQPLKYEDEILFNDIQSQNYVDYSEFRKRLPYNTTDAELIEQQHLLLDFLISNNICTEQNFTIFIAEPDNHKEEAARIVDQVVVIVNENTDFLQRLPYNTSDPVLIEQQHSFLNFLIDNDICTEENFDIFIANYETRYGEAEAIVTAIQTSYELSVAQDEIASEAALSVTDVTTAAPIINPIHTSDDSKSLDETNMLTEKAQSSNENLFPIFNSHHFQPLIIPSSTRRIQRSWIAGKGSDQYQIDAGQKNFGAQQCKQCGLVYTVHEPEEEKLHRDFHASLHVLRFKSWIDEDIVAIYPEWSPDGRILRIKDSSNIKRRERLMDILKIVDKELGFSSYIMPKTFVAYLAVRKFQIIGVCLVQPLQKANKYICVNGVDCCTQEEFEAKCGISRIWVSPLQRRLHVASKLIEAVQWNTIFGEEIKLDKIAFSAPTENGKMFAQKVTGMENFLVYQ